MLMLVNLDIRHLKLVAVTELGTPLFLRMNKKMILTPAGERRLRPQPTISQPSLLLALERRLQRTRNPSRPAAVYVQVNSKKMMNFRTTPSYSDDHHQTA
jgi:hypothetical protein